VSTPNACSVSSWAATTNTSPRSGDERAPKDQGSSISDLTHTALAMARKIATLAAEEKRCGAARCLSYSGKARRATDPV
jgi:hypothetical protein